MIAGECKPITPDWNATIMQPGSLPIVGSSQLKASIPHMYLWIDYCSMPQDLRDDDGGMVVGQAGGGMDAIRSTPSYIERTDLVLVMTPPAPTALGAAAGRADSSSPPRCSLRAASPSW